jgi:predicted porin
MNKKLIAIGIAAALAVPFTAAQAGVEVYGKVRASVDFNSNNDNTSGNKKDNMSLSSNASRLGFKGDEDLGNGLTAMWQFETTVNFDGGDTTPSGTPFGSERQTFIGVGGGFGAAMAGKLDTPYKSSTDKYDIFQDTKADFNGIMGNVGQGSSGALYDLRTNNTVAYVTPNMSGFSGKLAYVMPSTVTGSDNLPQTSAANKQDAYDVGVGYDMGPLHGKWAVPTPSWMPPPWR